MHGFGVNTYKLVNAAGEAVLVKYHWKTQQGVESLTQEQASAIQATELGARIEGPLRGDRARRLPALGAERPDHERRRAPRARLRPARRHQDLARGRVPAAAGRDDELEPQRRELLRRERADRVRHRRARRRARLLRRQDARRPHVLLLRHPALPGRPELPAAAGQRAATSGVATNQRDGQMAYYVDGARREPARQLRAVVTAGWPRRRAGARRAGPEIERPADARKRSAHERLRAGRRALPHDAESGSATTSWRT